MTYVFLAFDGGSDTVGGLSSTTVVTFIELTHSLTMNCTHTHSPQYSNTHWHFRNEMIIIIILH